MSTLTSVFKDCLFSKMDHSRPLFRCFRLFNTVDGTYNISHDWIWTADLWYWKRQLYQLCHNHSPKNCLLTLKIVTTMKIPSWSKSTESNTQTLTAGNIVSHSRPLFVSEFFSSNFTQLYCRLQRDSNSGCLSRRLDDDDDDHHHGPKCNNIYSTYPTCTTNRRMCYGEFYGNFNT